MFPVPNQRAYPLQRELCALTQQVYGHLSSQGDFPIAPFADYGLDVDAVVLAYEGQYDLGRRRGLRWRGQQFP